MGGKCHKAKVCLRRSGDNHMLPDEARGDNPLERENGSWLCEQELEG